MSSRRHRLQAFCRRTRADIWLARAGLMLCLLGPAACATFNPQPHDTIGYRERAVTKTDGGLSVSAVALGEQEAQKAFGVPLLRRGIQPVWLRIENDEEETFVLAPTILDADYYTPAEAAFINHAWYDGEGNRAMDELFQELAIELTVPPGAVNEGFVFVSPDLGSKFVFVVLLGDEGYREFSITVDVPGLELPRFDPDALYGADEIVDYALEDIRPALEALPCCVTDATGEIEADPLNFILIGEVDAVWGSLIGGGWDDAEAITTETALRTAGSSLFGSEYLYSPISALYAFGRPQDLGFQRARSDVDERNHIRLWLSPLRADGVPVWVGAISRDIGIITSGLGVTHKIDPDVDAERWYLAQNFAIYQWLERFGYVAGGPVSSEPSPRSSVEPKNIYYSDGYRIVLVLSEDPVPFDEIGVLDWIPIGDVDLGAKYAVRSVTSEATQ